MYAVYISVQCTCTPYALCCNESMGASRINNSCCDSFTGVLVCVFKSSICDLFQQFFFLLHTHVITSRRSILHREIQNRLT